MYGIKSIAVLLLCVGVISAHTLTKRGIPVSGPNSSDQQSAAAYARSAGNSAITQLQNQQRVAEWSASSAVGDAVGNDYSNQLANTAQFVAQFTVPVTKDQAQGVYNTIAYSQKASKISAALANSSGAIRNAARNAVHSNYEQAYQAQQAGYHRGGGGVHGGSGGYGGGSGGYGGGSSAWA